MEEQASYLRPSELAKRAGLPRTNIYYWISRLEIPTVTIAGFMLIPDDDDLPRWVVAIQAAKREVEKRRKPEASHEHVAV